MVTHDRATAGRTGRVRQSGWLEGHIYGHSPIAAYIEAATWIESLCGEAQDGKQMKEFMTIAKALADESRSRILMFLHGGELCVCQLIELLELAPSTVSKHMSILYQAGLVETRKEGRWVYYRLAGEGASPCALSAIAWLCKCAEKDQKIIEDNRKVEAVRAADLMDLCSHYHR